MQSTIKSLLRLVLGVLLAFNSWSPPLVLGFQSNPSRLRRKPSACESTREDTLLLEQRAPPPNTTNLAAPPALPPPPPDAPSNPDDDFFRWIRQTFPKKVQYFLRDSGALRSIVDGSVPLAARQVCQDYPSAFADFLHLSGLFVQNNRNSRGDDYKPLPGRTPAVQFKRYAYGDHKRQVVDVIHPLGEEKSPKKLVVFVHGGAWGSGFPSMYRLAAKPFVERGYSVAILGYRTWPDADAAGQIGDIAKSMDFLRSLSFSIGEITFVGHSSGAHIGLSGILRGQVKVDRFIGISGVYDIPEHYAYEKGRGVERFSPMAVACGGNLAAWKAHSPTRVAETTSEVPPVLILHGDSDTTVPYTSSDKIARSLKNAASNENDVCLEVLPGTDHAETVLQLMFGGPTQDKIFGWLD